MLPALRHGPRQPKSPPARRPAPANRRCASSPPYSSTMSRTIASPGRARRAARRRARRAPARGRGRPAAMPGPSSSTCSCRRCAGGRPRHRAARARAPGWRHHLQALSIRLPSSSSRSSRSPTNCSPARSPAPATKSLLACTLQQRRAQVLHSGGTGSTLAWPTLPPPLVAARRSWCSTIARHAVDLASITCALHAPLALMLADAARPAASSGCAPGCRACRDSARCACAPTAAAC